MSDGAAVRAELPDEGPALARELQRRHAGQDWLAALAQAARRPRGDVERDLQERGVLPYELRQAAEEVGDLLAEQRQPKTDETIFAARTNDAEAPMEVDDEAGTVVQPSNKGMPSESGSKHESGTQAPKAGKNSEFLPFSGIPEALAPLRKERD